MPVQVPGARGSTVAAPRPGPVVLMGAFAVPQEFPSARGSGVLTPLRLSGCRLAVGETELQAVAEIHSYLRLDRGVSYNEAKVPKLVFGSLALILQA